MTFYQFLIQNNVNPLIFLYNCLPTHQKWPEVGYTYENPLNIFNIPKHQWVSNAFCWQHSLQSEIPWYNIDDLWTDICHTTENITHGFPTLKEL